MANDLKFPTEDIEQTIRDQGHAFVDVTTSGISPISMTYTVGLSKKGTSDLMMMGSDHEKMRGILNDVAKSLDKGSIIKEERALHHINGAPDVILCPVPDLDASKFAHVLKSYAKGAELNLVQVVLPDDEGRFPDDEDCDPSCARRQNHLRLVFGCS